jgi:hypothetical protein
MKKITIEVEGLILPQDAEVLEDEIAEVLQKSGLVGKVESDLTGNTTVFGATSFDTCDICGRPAVTKNLKTGDMLCWDHS